MLLGHVFNGYKRLAIFLFRLGILLALTVGITFITVYPLWYAAVHHTYLYTVLVLSGMALFLVFFLIKNSIKKLKKTAASGTPVFLAVLLPFRLILKIIISFMMFYGIIILLFQGRMITGAVLALLFLFVCGVMFFPGPGKYGKNSY